MRKQHLLSLSRKVFRPNRCGGTGLRSFPSVFDHRPPDGHRGCFWLHKIDPTAGAIRSLSAFYPPASPHR